MDRHVSRRGFLRGASGTAAAVPVAMTGNVTAQEQRPDFDGWLANVDGGFEDARGQSEVTVDVGAQGNDGNFAFGPAGLWVDSGTTVRWNWTGEGGAHNVVAEEGPANLDSGSSVTATGVQYEHTFEEGGITTYFCNPHRSLGMKGAVAVGSDVPTAQAGGDGGGGGGGDTTPTPVGYQRPFGEIVIGGFASVFMIVALAGTMFLVYLGHQDDRVGGEESD